jgi:beta-lactam-binding protein with PASTA domain
MQEVFRMKTGRFFAVVIVWAVLSSISFGYSGWIEGKAGNALAFDGVNDYVEVPGYKGITGTASRTCSAWVKTPGSAVNTVMMSWGGLQWIFGFFAGGELAVYAGGPYIKTTMVLADNQWHHVAAVLPNDGTPDVSEIQLYVDGQLATTIFSAGAINTAASNDVLMGAFMNGSSPAGFLNGLLDEACIYNRALEPNEINPEAPVPTDGLIAHWAMDETEGGIVHDSVSSYDGILRNITSNYSGGWGSSEDPYQIATKQDLLGLAGFTEDYNKCFILTADIDLEGQIFTTAIIAPDTSTSSGFQGTAFTGTFDGNGHKITHFTINGLSNSYLGLFGYFGTGSQIKNLGLEDYSVKSFPGSSYIGGLVGYDDLGSISNCYSTGSIKGWSVVGGLVGYNTGGIRNCYAAGAVNGYWTVGGLTGHSTGNITRCYSTASVGGTSYIGGAFYVGGLAGKITGGTVSGNFWDIQTSGRNNGVGAGSNAGIHGRFTAQMQDINPFLSAGWDFAFETTNGIQDIWTISSGQYPYLAGQTGTPADTMTVPDVVSMAQADAGDAITTAGLTVLITYAYNDTVAARTVISQSPTAGTMLLAGMPVNIQVSLEPNTSLGSGTQEDPYKIGMVSDWQALMTTPANWNKYYILIVDLDLRNVPLTPVGNSTTAFAGSFNGNGHIIRNVTMNMAGSDNVGLFGVIAASGQVSNLGVESAIINGRSCVGALAGVNSGAITASYAAGAVTSLVLSSYTEYVGGLVGFNGGIIRNCYAHAIVANGNVISSNYGSYVGGLTGYNYYGSISNCYAAGVVIGSKCVGGLLGFNFNGSISNCFWDAQISGKGENTGGMVKTTTQMQDVATFLLAGWDFVVETINGTQDIWTILPGQYPRLAWQTGAPLQTVTVPDVVLMTQSEAQNVIAAAGLTAWITYACSDTIAAGTVVSQNPPADSVFLANAPLAIEVSLGSNNSGSGTEADPYRIGMAADWQTLMNTPANWNKHYILIADLDLQNIPLTPVGNSTTRFTGSFNGDGHVMRNITINMPNSSNVGLFGVINTGGQVYNLGLDSANITGCSYVGILAGANAGTISGCYAAGSVFGSEYGAGGLVGYNYYSSVINCYATGEVVGNSYAGGLIGNCVGGTVSNCYVTGVVSGNSSVGELIGYNNGNSVLSSFWDKETSGYIPTYITANSPDKTTAQMQDINTFLSAGWDFDFETFNGTQDIWTISPGQYPHLAWQAGDSPNTVTVPDVVSMTQVNAEKAIHAAGLEVWVTNVYSDTVAAGTVVSQSPAAGAFLLSSMPVITAVNIGPNAGSGSGTEADPYKIGTAADWQALMSTSVNWNKHFILIADLDLQRISVTPIGNSTTNFSGSFNGNGHIIRNATINMAGSNYVGLFGYIDTAGRVYNLGLDSANVTGDLYVGALAGRNLGTVITCYTNGTVISKKDDAGGLIGYNAGTVSNCYSETSVTALLYLDDYLAPPSPNLPWNDRSVEAGGLIGYNTGTISNCYATGVVFGCLSVGGLVDYNSGGSVNASFWDMESSGQAASAGGIGRMTAQMKTLLTFTSAGGDFTNETVNGTNDYWRMCVDGVDYPKLNWQSGIGDFACPDGVNMEDLEYFVGRWLMDNCTSGNNYCGGGDINASGAVDLGDYAVFARQWLEGI